jgi:hypothetical protein
MLKVFQFFIILSVLMFRVKDFGRLLGSSYIALTLGSELDVKP